MASKTSSRAASRHDAITLLTADHRNAMDLFEQFDKARESEDDESCAALVQEICSELTLHATVEEEVFYPAVRAAVDDDDLMDEAQVEHATARDLIAQLEEMEPGDPLYVAKVRVLCEYVRHHIGEEEGGMFRKARKAHKDGGLDLVALGVSITQRKQALQSGMELDEDAAAAARTGKPA